MVQRDGLGGALAVFVLWCSHLPFLFVTFWVVFRSLHFFLFYSWLYNGKGVSSQGRAGSGGRGHEDFGGEVVVVAIFFASPLYLVGFADVLGLLVGI